VFHYVLSPETFVTLSYSQEGRREGGGGDGFGSEWFVSLRDVRFAVRIVVMNSNLLVQMNFTDYVWSSKFKISH